VIPGVERDVATHDRRIAAEPALPQAVGQHRHALVLAADVERPSERRLHAEDAEEVGGHRAGDERFGVIAADQGHWDLGGARHAGEHVGAAPQVGQPSRAHRGGAPLALIRDEHQPVGVGVGQRAEQHRADDAEDGDGRPDAERQREDGGGRESGIPPQAADRVAHVVQDRLDGGADPRVAHPLLGLLEALALDQGGSPRLGRRQAGRRVAPLQRAHVLTQFVVEIPIEP